MGIYIGGGQFIHASTSSTGVIISDMDSAYYTTGFVGAAGSSDFLPLRYTGQAAPAGPACPFSVCVFFLLFGHTVLRYAPRHPLAGEERSTS